jgi:hypothetical protein
MRASSSGGDNGSSGAALREPLLHQPAKQQTSWWDWLGLGTREDDVARRREEVKTLLTKDVLKLQKSVPRLEAVLACPPKDASKETLDMVAASLEKGRTALRLGLRGLEQLGVELPAGAAPEPRTAQSGKTKTE